VLKKASFCCLFRSGLGGLRLYFQGCGVFGFALDSWYIRRVIEVNSYELLYLLGTVSILKKREDPMHG
jgi:hypothetical protein